MVGRGAGFLFAAIHPATSCVPSQAVEFVGESGDEFVLLVEGEARDSHGVLREELKNILEYP